VTEQTDRQTKLRTDEDEKFNMNRLVAWLATFGSRLLIFRDFPFADKVVLYLDMAAIRQTSSSLLLPSREYLCDEGMFSWSFQVGRLFEFCLFCSLHFESRPLVANSFALER
jgi:hypothetical protein